MGSTEEIDRKVDEVSIFWGRENDFPPFFPGLCTGWASTASGLSYFRRSLVLCFRLSQHRLVSIRRPMRQCHRWRWSPVCQRGAVSSYVTFSLLPAASGSQFKESETLLHFLFSGGPVCGGYFPGVGVDAQSFEVAFEMSLPRSCGRPCDRRGPTIPCVSVWGGWTWSHASLFEEGEHGWDACSFEPAFFVTLSLHEMPRMRLKQHISKLLSLLSCRERWVQDSCHTEGCSPHTPCTPVFGSFSKAVYH